MKSYSNIRYFYLRDNNRNPHSCVVMQLDRESNIINYQVATLSSKEGKFKNTGDYSFVKTPFIKKMARYIACQRLAKRSFQVPYTLDKVNSHGITRLVMEDIINNCLGYKIHDPIGDSVHVEEIHMIAHRARKAAKKWLHTHIDDQVTLPSLKVARVKGGDTLPPSFPEDLASDELWDSIPIPPVAKFKLTPEDYLSELLDEGPTGAVG